MNEPGKELLKFQEWVVMFDGKIKQSEHLTNRDEYNKRIKTLFEDKV